MSDFISGVANPMTAPTDMRDKPTFIPPPTQHTGVFGPPGYGRKDNTVTFLGIKPNKPVRIQGTKTK